MQTYSDLPLTVLLSCILAVCVAASASLPSDYDQLRYRSAPTDDIGPKPVRDDGLGSLLLKNLRFRDLERSYGSRSLANSLLWDLQKLRAEAGNGEKESDLKVEKRPSVSASQLAELLHNLQTRGIDDNGVKLQSLRFGK